MESREPYVLASLKIKGSASIVPIAPGVTIGGSGPTIIAGPCSIESYEQICTTAQCVKKSGAHILRGGAYKPRTSPYSFQGTGREGLKWLKMAGEESGLPIITEILDQDDLSVVCDHADIVQVGARNCQNYAMLKKLGKIRKPVVLKRGMMMTVEELLLAAEYILSGGNRNVILCERGIRTFETGTRNTLDISAVPLLKQKTHLPVIVDPSHAAGNWKLIEPLSFAAIAAGADGLMIEVHPEPEKARCDGEQSLTPARFDRLMNRVKQMGNWRLCLTV
ncbi:MAG: 3-deoxy-7-phosphoheptulonate synthase [Spirochaetales bacterium]|nr:3-deoxy-7-phosphoheptulonate synthase [Spirochaetales bacterium]